MNPNILDSTVSTVPHSDGPLWCLLADVHRWYDEGRKNIRIHEGQLYIPAKTRFDNCTMCNIRDELLSVYTDVPYVLSITPSVVVELYRASSVLKGFGALFGDDDGASLWGFSSMLLYSATIFIDVRSMRVEVGY